MGNDMKIERAVLATALYDSSFAIEESGLRERDFLHPLHAAMYREIVKAKNEKGLPPDETDLVDALKKRDLFEEGAFLDLIATTPVAAAEEYVKKIRENARLWRTKQALLDALGKLEKGEGAGELVFAVERIRDDLDGEAGDESTVPAASELLRRKMALPEKFETGVAFLDENLGGGLEVGQLVTITGEQEAGKTILLNQITFHVAKSHPVLYFALEFNRRQFVEYLRREKLDPPASENLRVVTDEVTDGEIGEIVSLIRRCHRRYGTKFVAIDSQMMLHDNSESHATGEERTTSIFRRLQALSSRLDICIVLISQMSKEDHRSERVEIFGSKKAAHLARIMIHIDFERKKAAAGENKRRVYLAKNKQTGRLAANDLFFDEKRLRFASRDESAAAPIDETALSDMTAYDLI